MDLGTKEFSFREAAEAGAWCQLTHPVTKAELGVKEGAPVRILIQGMDAVGFDASMLKSVALRASGPTIRGNLSDKRADALAEENIETQARELTESTIGWENIDWNGSPLEFNRANAHLLYATHKWIREQVITFIGERANYAGNVSAP